MEDVLQLAGVMLTLLTTGLLTYGGYVGIRKWEQRGTLSGEDRRELQQVNHRLDRMELAIEAIAVEMERVAEGQRFTTRLLSERGAIGADALPAGGAGQAGVPAERR